ncbi:hypothetical protein F5Y14DRAFT_401632 [Nemania sp. NC0429]|nr:hypothetical protein F5Y14DRAFT_401632 [Nemania sp. NC0429]
MWVGSRSGVRVNPTRPGLNSNNHCSTECLSQAIEARAYPEFIPAPGFPSLASPNLTTEMIHKAPKFLSSPDGSASIGNVFSPAYTDHCDSEEFVTANVDDVILCFNFLVALGDYVITVTSNAQKCTVVFPPGCHVQQRFHYQTCP